MNPSDEQNRKELADFLRALADDIENPSIEFEGGIDIHNNFDSQRTLLSSCRPSSIVHQSISIQYDLRKYNVEEVKAPK